MGQMVMGHKVLITGRQTLLLRAAMAMPAQGVQAVQGQLELECCPPPPVETEQSTQHMVLAAGVEAVLQPVTLLQAAPAYMARVQVEQQQEPS